MKTLILVLEENGGETARRADRRLSWDEYLRLSVLGREMVLDQIVHALELALQKKSERFR